MAPVAMHTDRQNVHLILMWDSEGRVLALASEGLSDLVNPSMTKTCNIQVGPPSVIPGCCSGFHSSSRSADPQWTMMPHSVVNAVLQKEDLEADTMSFEDQPLPPLSSTALLTRKDQCT